MAEIKPVQKVLPFVGLILSEGFQVDAVMKKLSKDMGGFFLQSDTIPFVHTKYYNQEMGDKLFRQWLVFEKLIVPDEIIGTKIRTNEIEKEYLNAAGGRKVNIDPGLLSLSNIILASTKNYSHRIYLGKGIYGEVTLIFKEHEFRALEWTYPDYREKMALDFFTNARETLKERLASPDRFSKP